MTDDVSKNALFVCFGGMSNVAMLTGLEGLAVIRQAPDSKAGIFCLGGLATEAQWITPVDGCPLNCALKTVEGAGYTRYKDQPGG